MQETAADLFLPKLAIVWGLVLLLLIFPLFISHVVENINASSITQNITNRTLAEINTLFEHKPINASQGKFLTFSAPQSGYLESVDFTKLENLLADFSFIQFRIVPHVGAFTIEDSPLIEIEIDDHQAMKLIERKIVNCLKISKFRSYTQDVMFGVRQLVDIAIKAISPAINDPTTALNCIDQLGVVISKLAASKDQSMNIERLKNKNILIREFNFEQLIDVSFDQIYHWGKGDYIVVRHLIKVITMIVPFTNSVEKLKILAQEIEEMELDFVFQRSDFEQCNFDRKEHRNSIRNFMNDFYQTFVEHSANFPSVPWLEAKTAEYEGLIKNLPQYLEYE